MLRMVRCQDAPPTLTHLDLHTCPCPRERHPQGPRRKASSWPRTHECLRAHRSCIAVANLSLPCWLGTHIWYRHATACSMRPDPPTHPPHAHILCPRSVHLAPAAHKQAAPSCTVE